jgi:hypothetical protein
MSTTTFDLSEPQATALRSLADQTGKPEAELIREAIDRFLDHAGVEVSDWRGILRAGEGLWKDRDDVPDLAELRSEMDRDL